MRQERLDEAVAGFRRAVALNPGRAMPYLNLGAALRRRGDYDEAIGILEKGRSIEPDMAAFSFNLGVAYYHSGDVDEALAAYDRAVALQPDHLEAQVTRGIIRLSRGELEEGWRDYLHRPSTRDDASELFRKKLPRCLDGEALVLRRDQGFGDEIFFLRYVPEIKRRGAAHIAYEAGSKLASIARRIAGIDRVLEPGETADASVPNISVGDLPFVLDMNDIDGVHRRHCPSPPWRNGSSA